MGGQVWPRAFVRSSVWFQPHQQTQSNAVCRRCHHCLQFVGLCVLYVGDSCNTQGMTECYNQYMAGVGGLSGTAVCDHVNTLTDCLSSTCAGCDPSAMSAFQATIDTQKPALCTNPGATCPSHALCTNTVACY